jgi:uncharacterized protein YjbJ (UPF0337 family)
MFATEQNRTAQVFRLGIRKSNPDDFRQNPNRRIKMNKDQVKGMAKEVAGKVQQKTGELIGSKEQQIKGLSKQISGKAQKGVGDLKQSVEDIKNS